MVEDVITIEVTSPTVPNLTLIDLPGLVAAKSPNEPEDMMEQTRALVEKYLKREHTLFLAVVRADSRMRASQALQLIKNWLPKS